MSLIRPCIARSSPLVLACRPVLAGPSTYRRSFSTSIATRLEVKHANHASTALKTNVRDREERADAADQVVGAEVKGSEGAHYQDQVPVTINPLTDLSRTGAWTMMNPIYTTAELEVVKVVHRPETSVSDKIAHKLVKVCRHLFDFFSGYRETHVPAEVLSQTPIPVDRLRKEGKLLSDQQWLYRIIFLESIAGVPGMVAGTLRHLRSLRLLRRDGGWIHTLLEEAENERMHLLTFMAIAQPGIFARTMILAAQGVFYNMFFFTYLISPSVAHRFVGALEEEAVRTYTHCVNDIQTGLLPEWKEMPAPQIAKDYWRLPEDAMMLDVVKAVRADEATHRFVNHSLANLEYKKDFNPFALAEPSAELRGTTFGFTREQSAEFARQSQGALHAPAQQKLLKQ